MDLFSQAQVDALRRLKDAFEQKLLDEDEYKAEKAKVLNATPAAAPAPAAPSPPIVFSSHGFLTTSSAQLDDPCARQRRSRELQPEPLWLF